MRVLLRTERLMLRRLTEADADHLVALDSDPEVMRYLTGGAPTPRDVIEREILPRFLRSYEQGDGYGVWAVIERATGDFLGWLSFQRQVGGVPGSVSLGYRLRRSAWGKGYAAEGARALIRKGFAELGARRIVATTYQDNLASRRVMEKVGMTLAHVYHLTPADLAAESDTFVSSGELWDGADVEYELLRADWERQEAAGDEKESRDAGLR